MKKQTNSEELPFLSDVINLDDFCRGQANVIIAPCHSGKTTAAKNIISAHSSCPERALFLIDTTAGRDAILKHTDSQRYSDDWHYGILEDPTDLPFDYDGYCTMTYHQFGIKILEDPHFVYGIELIICDEMHNLLKYIGIEHKNNLQNNWLGSSNEIASCKTALKELDWIASHQEDVPLLVVMTATANALYKHFESNLIPAVYTNFYGRVHSDTTLHRHYYSNLKALLSALPPDEKAIVFIPRITMMKEYAAIAEAYGHKTCCLWGLRNTDHQMSEKQLSVRQAILDSALIPPDIDLLFINSAYETSINIKNTDFNTMIIHHGNADTQIQVRGRLRHDIENLYLYDADHEFISHYFPASYYDRLLFREDIKSIIDEMNLSDSNGRQLKWPSIATLLAKDGIIVTPLKEQGRRGYILRRSA